MEDGYAISYKVLQRGTPVRSSANQARMPDRIDPTMHTM
jgi:hypothetical protein